MEDHSRMVAGGNLLEAHTWKAQLEVNGAV